MVRINGYGYLERKTSGASNGKRGLPVYRDWWLIKGKGIVLNTVSFPTCDYGKRARIKVEFIDEENHIKTIVKPVEIESTLLKVVNYTNNPNTRLLIPVSWRKNNKDVKGFEVRVLKDGSILYKAIK